MTNSDKSMTGEQCMKVIENLASQQGFYTRLNSHLKALKHENPDDFSKFMQELEKQNFNEPVDLIMYLET